MEGGLGIIILLLGIFLIPGFIVFLIIRKLLDLNKAYHLWRTNLKSKFVVVYYLYLIILLIASSVLAYGIWYAHFKITGKGLLE